MAIALAAFVVGSRFDDVALGNLGEWVGGVGTVTALGASLFLLHQGQEDRRREATDRERQQARLITHWVGVKTFDGDEWTLADPPTGPCLYIKNGSQEAIYDVTIQPEPYDSDGEARGGLIGVVAPGETREAFWPYWPDRPSATRPLLNFVDSNGIAWQRNAFRLNVLSRNPKAIKLVGMDMVEPPAPRRRPDD